LIVRDVRSPKNQGELMEVHLLKLMESGADVDTVERASSAFGQTVTSEANSVCFDVHALRHPYSLTLDQLVREEALKLSSLAGHVHTREQLCEWVSGPLRRAVPHQHALLLSGRCHSLGVKLNDFIEVNLPDTYLGALQSQADEIDSPLLERWCLQRKLMFLSAEEISAYQQTRWGDNFLSHGLRSVLIDGWVDQSAQTVTLLKLYNCHPEAVAPMTLLREVIGVALASMWTRIAQVEALTRTDKLKIIAALSPAEKEVVHWLKLGKTNAEIAQILGKSEHTVKTQVHKTLMKTGAVNRTALAQLDL
jgi:DNA-binding CsgD family transcriptional regulator